MTRAHDQQGDLSCRFCGDPCQCGYADAAEVSDALSPPMTSPAASDWPIATDGPNRVGEQRRWLARKLMDSSLTDAEAFSVVAFHGDIKDAAQTSPAAGAVEELVQEMRLAACGLFTLKNERGDYGYFDELADRLSALSLVGGGFSALRASPCVPTERTSP